MYGKIFEQIYNSTVCQDWKTLIVFQQCIILSDDLGILDMTPEAISRRTGIPLEIILHGIKELEKPDPRSRSKKSEGRRLERIDDHRDWGWVVVNKVEYRKLASRLEKQNNDKERIANKRAKSNVSQGVADSSDPSPSVADVAHTDTDTDTDTNLKTKATSSKLDLSTFSYLSDKDFAELWEAFLDNRKKMKVPNGDHALKLLLTKLHKWGVETAKEALRVSIERGWRGVFEPKPEQKQDYDPLRVEL